MNISISVSFPWMWLLHWDISVNPCSLLNERTTSLDVIVPHLWFCAIASVWCELLLSPVTIVSLKQDALSWQWTTWWIVFHFSSCKGLGFDDAFVLLWLTLETDWAENWTCCVSVWGCTSFLFHAKKIIAGVCPGSLNLALVMRFNVKFKCHVAPSGR